MTPDITAADGLVRAAQPGAGRATASSSDGAGPGRTLTSDFETFLRMLTVQMQNQDPLNPIESSDFAVQLATFSGVEQQVLTNDLLTGLAGRMSSAPGLSDHAAWVGMDARSAAPVDFDGAPIDLMLLPHPSADAGQIVVRDDTGAVVQEQPIPSGTDSLSWDGTAPGAPPLPPGTYNISVRWLQAGVPLVESPAESYQTVTEVRLAPGGAVQIVLQGGAAVAADAITAIRGGASGSDV